MSDDVIDLASGFNRPSLERWRAEVDRVLTRGKPDLDEAAIEELFHKVLETTTYDGLHIDPLYTAASEPPPVPAAALAPPGQAPYVRGTRPLGQRRFGWQVRQIARVTGPDPALADQILDELERGTTEIVLDLCDAPTIDVDLLDTVLHGIHLELVPVVVEAGPRQRQAADALVGLWARRGTPAHEARAVLGLDPIGRWLRTAGHEAVEPALDHLFATLRRTGTQVVPAVVDASLVHESGGGEVEELAYATACGVEVLRAATAAGLTVDEIATRLEFRFSATPDQFLTIAKLRAARRLWHRVASVAGGSIAAQRQRQHATTSVAATSRYDLWVNLLRVTVACFGAGVGGADAVTVLPHDHLVVPGSTELGRRMARNAQLILIEESNLAAVVDVAGGSWYVESLTDQLAQAAWTRFQAIEAAGGAIAACRAGLIQAEVARTAALRDEAVAHRRHPLTGVSEFPDIGEDPPPPLAPADAVQGPVAPLVPRRHADPVEQQRARGDQRERTGAGRPEVFLVAMGTPAAHTARSTFAKNLFEVGGIRAIVPDGFDTVEDAVAAFVASGAPLACICGTDAAYEAHGPALVEALAGLPRPPIRLYLAGRPPASLRDLLGAGLDEAMVAGGDVLDVLRRAHDVLDATDPIADATAGPGPAAATDARAEENR